MTDTLPTSPIPVDAVAALRPYVVPRHPAPVDLKLDSNEGLLPPREILRGLADADPELMRRYPHDDQLNALFAERFGVDEDRILVTSGVDDALERAFKAMLAPGRELVLPVPTFDMLPRYGALAGAEIREIRWTSGPFPTREVLEAVTPATALIPVVSPNNPTGAVATASDLVALAEAAPHVLIVVDQAYGEFAEEDLFGAALALPNAVVMRTLSKAWGLAGLRVGVAIGPARIIDWLKAAGRPYAVSSVSLALAGARVAGGQAEMAAHVARVRREREEIRDVLGRCGIEAPPSQANFVYAESERAPWLRDACAALGIGIRAWPGHPILARSVRITCPGDEEDQARLCGAIEAALAPEALLFDMDGVLADVSRSYREAILATAATYGVTLTFDDVARVKARGNANNDWRLTRELLDEKGVDARLDGVTERFERIYQGTPDAPGLRATETLVGGRGLLERLAARMPLAVVTGRPRSDATRFLEEQGIADLFSALVCMEDAPLKPDPGPVREALARLGASRAWMVGDTPDDIRAARKAGVVPLAVVAPGEDAEAAARELPAVGAARVLGSLAELEELLP